MRAPPGPSTRNDARFHAGTPPSEKHLQEVLQATGRDGRLVLAMVTGKSPAQNWIKAEVAEQADALRSGRSGLYARVSSNLTFGTTDQGSALLIPV
jgi:hypothetical protein